MGNMKRRDFIRSTATLAAGAAVGEMIWKGIKEHGPVEIRTYFFSKDPIVIKGALFSDEHRNVFGVRIFDKNGETAVAEMPLSAVKDALSEGTAGRVKVAMAHVIDGKRKAGFVDIIVKDGNFTFLIAEPGHDPLPVWLKLADVQRVV